MPRMALGIKDSVYRGAVRQTCEVKKQSR
jgi:hypothetical protein